MTLSLAIGASIIWLVAGVTVGVISALRRGTVFDRAAMGVALAGVSLPIFFTGLVSLAFFSYRLAGTAPGGQLRSVHGEPGRVGVHLLLPWITLSFLFAAQYARLTRAGMLETMNEDYIRTARAKGLPERTVVVKHGLRAALTPILTIFGLDVGLLLGRRDPHREDLLAQRSRQVRLRRASSTTTCRRSSASPSSPASS